MTLTCSPTHNVFPPAMRGLSQYDIPVLLHPHPRKLLIVRAGSGTHAAGGLRHGVKQITAVEIDPAIIISGVAITPKSLMPPRPSV